MKMQRNITEIELDICQDVKRGLVSAKQGDKATRFISVLVKDGLAPYPLPEDAVYIANVRKPDRKYCYNYCEIEEGRILVELTNQMLASAGTAVCDVEIRSNNEEQTLSTVSFEIVIKPSVRSDEAILSCNETTVLQEVVEKAETIIKSEKNRCEAEQLREQQEQLREHAIKEAEEALETVQIIYDQLKDSDLTEIAQELGEIRAAMLEIAQDIEQKVDKEEGKTLSANSFTTAEKQKLAAVEQNANAYLHPVTSGNRHIPSGGTKGQVLIWSADGTASWGAGGGGSGSVDLATETEDGLLSSQDFGKLRQFTKEEAKYLGGVTGAIQTQLDAKAKQSHTHSYAGSSSAGGAANLAVQAEKDSSGQKIDTTYLKQLSASGSTITCTKGDGSTQAIITKDTTYSPATTTTNGLMSASDKGKLAGIETGANAYTHPAFSSSTIGESYNKTLDYGGTFIVPQITRDTNGHVSTLSGRTMTMPSSYTLPTANTNTLGGVKVGNNIQVSSGQISVLTATTSNKGLVQLSNSVVSSSTNMAATSSAVRTVHEEVAEVKKEVEDSGWITPTLTNNFRQYNTSNAARFRKIGNMVHITGAVAPSGVLTGSNVEVIIFTLPQDYCPAVYANILSQGTGLNKWLLTINPSGTVTFSRYGTTAGYVDTTISTWLPLQATFFVN